MHASAASGFSLHDRRLLDVGQLGEELGQERRSFFLGVSFKIVLSEEAANTNRPCGGTRFPASRSGPGWGAARSRRRRPPSPSDSRRRPLCQKVQILGCRARCCPRTFSKESERKGRELKPIVGKGDGKTASRSQRAALCACWAPQSRRRVFPSCSKA
jgi:hypothetical protein